MRFNHLLGCCGANAKVEDLIDKNSRTWWKSDLIDDIFFEHEAKGIKGLPLSPIAVEDKLIWRCTAPTENSQSEAHATLRWK
jgi:hypothetical protein